MGGLEAKLLAAGLKRGLPVAGDWLTAELRERGVLPESDAETVFVDTLREEFEAAAQRATGDASEVLYSVALNWDAVETRLATIDTAFETEEEAVAEIVDRIESAEAVTLRVTEKETLQRVVARAYRETVDSYGERLADSGFAEAFQVEANLQLSEQIREVCGRLDEIADRAVPTERFDWYDPTDPAAVESVVDRIVETERASFVDRPELDGVPDAERLLVVGAAGSGKSRVLGEAVERVADAGRVSQIVTPRRDLVSHRDEWAFEYETFDGDVLLVWDDVHEITEDGNLDAFQSAVSTLERVLDEQGHDLHVVAAVRSGNVADLPGVESVDSIRRKPSGLWEPFAVIELGELDGSRLGEIASQRARIHEVAFADDDARQTLVEKSRGPSAPEYIDAVIRTQGDSEDDPEASVVVTETDVADTPDSISDIWYEQFYDVLDDRDQRAVLKACKLWYDLGIPYVAPLVRAVWTEVLDRPGGKTAFKQAVNSLVERKWVALAGESPLDDETLLWMHDTQCDAVEWDWTDRIPDISAALRNEDQYLTDDDNELFVRAGGQFANRLRHVERETTDVQETHYLRLLAETADTDEPLDSTDAEAHSNYAILLKEIGRVEKAKQHYKRALVETADTNNSTLAVVSSNYANLLRDMGQTEKAKQHYKRALVETADTDDPLDSVFAEAHYNYAILLEDKRQMKQAERHYERALVETADTDDPLDSKYAKAHYNYAILLEETKKAKQHYKRALTETADTDDLFNPTDAKAHHRYANLLSETGRMEKAAQHYEWALVETADTDDPLDSTDAEAHYNYGHLLYTRDRFTDARPHLERSVDLWLERDERQNVLHGSEELVETCETLGDHERAVEHCERAIEVASELGDSDREREFRELYATLDGRELEDRVREQYTFGLQAVQRHDWETAGDLLPSAWELHEAFESQDPPYWMTLAAGVWCRVILDAGGITANEDVDEQILSALVADTSLSPVAEELYSYYSATESIRVPQFFAGSNEADDRDDETTALVKQAELGAYQTLYDFL